jgi:hypothetical protein
MDLPADSAFRTTTWPTQSSCLGVHAVEALAVEETGDIWTFRPSTPFPAVVTRGARDCPDELPSCASRCARSVSAVLEPVCKDSLGVRDSRALPDSNNEPTACFIESLEGRGGMAGIVCLPVSRGSAIRSTKVMLSSSSSARLKLRPRGLRARTPAAEDFFAPRPAGTTTRGGAPPTPPTSEARMSDHRRRFPSRFGPSAPMRSRRSVISQLSHSPATSSSSSRIAGGRVAPSLRPPSFSGAILSVCAPLADGLMERE